MHVSTLIATLSSSDDDDAPRGTDTGASRLVAELRARFRRGSHRLGGDPKHQWTMTHAAWSGSAMAYSSAGRTGEARLRERNPLQAHLRHNQAGWHAT